MTKTHTPPMAATPAPNALVAALWMMAAIAAFSLMAVAGRELSDTLSSFEIMLWRSIVGFVFVVVAIMASTRGFAQLKTDKLGLHGLRNVAHFFGQNCWFYALGVIPLAQVFALEFTSPIWVLLLAPVFLGEAFTKWRALAALLGFVGILLVTRTVRRGRERGRARLRTTRRGAGGARFRGDGDDDEAVDGH